MASGFFFGGMAPGITNAANSISQNMQLQSLQQLAVAQNQQRQKHADFMQLRSQAVDHLGETIKQIRIAHPELTDLQLAANPAIVSQRDQLQNFDKNLGLPNTADSIVAGFVSRPSETTQTKALAEASGTYGKNQAETQELQARTRVYNQAAGVGEQGTQSNPDLDADTQLGGKPFVSSGNRVADNIVKAIKDGDQPPVLTGLYGKSPMVRSGLEANGVDVSKLQLQWKQAEKQVQSLNGPQMTRYIGLNQSVQNTIGEALDLSKQMKLSGIPALNSAELQSYIQTQGNSANGQLATRYMTTINTLKEEFANLAQGGYAPTDPAWKLADQQINGNYGWQQLPASLNEIQKLVKIRLNAIPGINTVGPGSSNQYTGNKGQSGSVSKTYNYNPDTGELE